MAAAAISFVSTLFYKETSRTQLAVA
jgi:hypothetical protein